MMRTFTVRPSASARLLALLLWVIAAALLWHRLVLPGAVVLLAALVAVERIVHTRYVVDGRCLAIVHGRLSRTRNIPLHEIEKADLAGADLLVTLRSGRTIRLRPINAQSLRRLLTEEME